MQMPSHRQQQFFRDALDAGGNVRVVLIHPAHLLVICRGLAKIFWEAGCLCEEGHSGRAWLAKQFHKTAVEGAIGGVVKAEVAHIQRSHLQRDRKSTRLNSSHVAISYAVFCLKKKNKNKNRYEC